MSHESTGAELARQVVAEMQTEDVMLIAARVGVKIVYRRWPLVTVGEYDPRTATISVNLAALERARVDEPELSAEALGRVIVAHELGHFFAARDGEHTAHDFAAALLRLNCEPRRYEKLWRE